MSGTITTTLTNTYTLTATPTTITATGGIISSIPDVNGIVAPVGIVGSLVNDGTISVGLRGDGVLLEAGGTIVNGSSTDPIASISGYNGIVTEGAPSSVTNFGSISGFAGGGNVGVNLADGGTFQNMATGSVTGHEEGVVLGAVGTIINAGAITASGAAIELDAGGTIDNLAGGNINGTSAIRLTENAPGQNITIDNAGTIHAGLYNAISFGGADAAALSVTNFGLIDANATSDAIGFASGVSNRLTLEGSSAISGIVDGGNLVGSAIVSTLELANGAGAGTLSGLGSQYINFGSIAVDGGADWTLDGSNMVDGTLTNAGTLVAGGTLSGNGVLQNSGLLTTDPAGATIAIGTLFNDGTIIANGTLAIEGAVGPGTGPGGALEVGAGATLAVSGLVASSEALGFEATSGRLTLGTMPAAGTPIAGFAGADQLDLTGLAYEPGQTTAVFADGTLTVGNGISSDRFVLSGVAAGTLFSAVGDGLSVPGVLVEEAAPCFVAGTRIATARGEIPVEALVEGDLALTASGATRPVRWIGHRRVFCDLRDRTEDVCPVRVTAHTFGPGRPKRDLLLSPDHALYLDGVLIPVHLLVDGVAIRREPVQLVTYFHVELDRHDVLLAEGLPAESYCDTGNRHQFANAPLVALHAEFGPGPEPAETCAPMVLCGAAVDAVRAQLRDRMRVRSEDTTGSRPQRRRRGARSGTGAV